jgi:hypothetical protein
LAQPVPARLSAREGRRFAFTVGVAFLIIGAFIAWRGGDTPVVVCVAAGGTLLGAGLFVPGHLTALHRLWMRGAQAISYVTTPLFLGLVFYLMIVPIGLAGRLVGHRPLVPRDRQGTGYWVERAAHQRQGDLRRQF